ncbi:MAG: SurA N-terminal domain-containing protein [Treponema sp.]|nr:SurA N-terminal domain-containing protein [Treponema sp.]
MAKAKKTNTTEEKSGFSELAQRFKDHPFVFGGTVILLIFIIIAFVFVPTMPSIQQDSEGLVFGYYNGKPINQNAYFNNMLQETARMQNFDLQSDYGMNYMAAVQVWYQAFVKTAIHMAVLEEMKLTGYKVPATEIDRLVASRPEFQEDGRFSMVKYNNFGKSRLQTLWRNTEEEYTAAKFFNDFIGLKTSTAEKNFIGAMSFPERSFEIVSFPRSIFPESEIISFASARQDLFNTIHLSRITMGSEKEARQLLDSIQKGQTTFEDAARNHSTDPEKERGGDMGRRMAYEIFTDFQEESDRNAVISLKRGEFSTVIKGSNDSWIFFRAEENPFAADLSLEENLDKVRSYIDRFEGGRLENWLVAFTEELLGGAKQQDISLSEYILFLREQQNPDSPERLLALENVSINSFGPISMNYNNMGGSQSDRGLMLFANTINTDINPELIGAASNEVFWRNAFKTPLNTPSSPFSLGYSIIVLTPVEETSGDETSIENIGNFYTWGFMFNAISLDVNAAFISSSKFENNFYDVFMPLLFNSFGLND